MSVQITLQKKHSKEFGKKRYVGLNETSRLTKSNNLVLKSLQYGHISANSLEAARSLIKKSIKKNMSLSLRVYPYMQLTQKPAEVRMGHGKGGRVRGWYAFVRPGDVIFELKGMELNNGIEIFNKGLKKLPVKTATSFCLKF